MLRKNRDPYADSNRAAVTLDFNGRCQVLRNLLSYCDSTVESSEAWLKQNCKLVSANAILLIGPPQCLPQTRAKFAQHLIARGMAQPVVDVFESVKIHFQQGDLFVSAIRKGNQMLHLPDKQVSIAESR